MSLLSTPLNLASEFGVFFAFLRLHSCDLYSFDFWIAVYSVFSTPASGSFWSLIILRCLSVNTIQLFFCILQRVDVSLVWIRQASAVQCNRYLRPFLLCIGHEISYFLVHCELTVGNRAITRCWGYWCIIGITSAAWALQCNCLLCW